MPSSLSAAITWHDRDRKIISEIKRQQRWTGAHLRFSQFSVLNRFDKPTAGVEQRTKVTPGELIGLSLLDGACSNSSTWDHFVVRRYQKAPAPASEIIVETPAESTAIALNFYKIELLYYS
jgi:hypothetical protein